MVHIHRIIRCREIARSVFLQGLIKTGSWSITPRTLRCKTVQFSTTLLTLFHLFFLCPFSMDWQTLPGLPAGVRTDTALVHRASFHISTMAGFPGSALSLHKVSVLPQ